MILEKNKEKVVNYLLNKIYFMKKYASHSISTQIKKDCIAGISYGLPDLLNDIMSSAIQRNDVEIVSLLKEMGAQTSVDIKDYTLLELKDLLKDEIISIDYHKIYSRVSNILQKIDYFGKNESEKAIDELILFAIDNEENKALEILSYFPHLPDFDEDFIKLFVKTKNSYGLDYIVKDNDINLSKYTLINHDFFAENDSLAKKKLEFNNRSTLKDINDLFKENLKDNNFCNYLTQQDIYRRETYYLGQTLPKVNFIKIIKPESKITSKVKIEPITEPVIEQIQVTVELGTNDLIIKEINPPKIPIIPKIKPPPGTIVCFDGTFTNKEQLQKKWDTLLLNEYFLNNDKKLMGTIFNNFFIENKISSYDLIKRNSSLMRLPMYGHSFQKRVNPREFVIRYIPEMHKLLCSRNPESVLNNIDPFLNKINKDKMHTHKHSEPLANKIGKIKAIR